MTEALGIVSVVLVLWLVTVLIVAALAARRLGRANRVAATVKSPAPLRWHWTHSRPARLHRRLQAAVWPIDPGRPQPQLPPAVGTDELRTDLVAAALTTDAGLAALRHAPARVRRTAWREASARVATIEDLSARVRGAAPPPARWTRPVRVRPPALDELAERVACLEHGRAQVAQVELLQAGRFPAVSPVNPLSPVGPIGPVGRVSPTPTPTR